MRQRVVPFLVGAFLASLFWIGCLFRVSWENAHLSGQIRTAAFVGHQFERCWEDIRDGDDPDHVLGDLSWSFTYHDGMTNILNESMLGYLMREDRKRTAVAVIQYVRKKTTNDYGDDPYKWFEHK